VAADHNNNKFFFRGSETDQGAGAGADHNNCNNNKSIFSGELEETI
jgi:hypothetical protein